MIDTKSLKALANAKINLHLEVLDRRSDAYHNISTIFQSVDLADEVTITVSQGDEVSVITENAVIEGENLAQKAAELFLIQADIKAKVEIVLKKSIPLLSGLAGGSADAAAVLVCLNRLFDSPVAEDKLLELGKTLGADIPFCMVGGSALAENIGEKLSPIENIGSYYAVLIKHHKKSSTGEMYKRLDKRSHIPPCSTQKLLSLIKNGDMLSAGSLAKNSFLDVSDSKEQQRQIIDKLKKHGALFAGLSGSGPTVFGLFKTVDEGLVLELRQNYNEVYLCHTAKEGVKIIE